MFFRDARTVEASHIFHATFALFFVYCAYALLPTALTPLRYFPAIRPH
jgi:hypothetical protein